MSMKMRKIGSLTEDTYNKIEKDGTLDVSIREVLGIPETKKVRIGDTMCMIGQSSKEKDIFKFVQNGREVTYVVISPLDEMMAFCYSIFPC